MNISKDGRRVVVQQASALRWVPEPERVWHLTCFERLAGLEPGAFGSFPALKTLALLPSSEEVCPTATSPKEGQSLPVGLFDGLGALETLSVTMKWVTAVTPGAFRGLSALKHLELDGNRIATLAPNAFEGIEGLETLSLDRNEFRTIGSHFFSSLDRLLTLSLEGNRITRIEAGAFKNSRLVVLGLEHNRIRSVDPEAFLGATALASILLTGNPMSSLAPRVAAVLAPHTSVALGSADHVRHLEACELVRAR